MKTKLLIVTAIVVAVPIGFYYYISINGFSTYHAGINVELLSEKQLERFSTDYEIKNVTKEELEQFPQIQTMINLLLEEKEDPQGTRSFFVGLETYRIFDSGGELKIQNHMSDFDASNTHREFVEQFGSSVIVYHGSYFSISSWIA